MVMVWISAAALVFLLEILISAISMVATPHCGDCSLSDDLSSDEASATGSRQSFALKGKANFVWGKLLW